MTAKKILVPSVWYFCVLMMTFWVIGFGAFCLYALSFKFQPAEKTDAIVVLTGGGDRIPKALSLLSEQYAHHLFISGVNETVKLSDLTRGVSPQLIERITLGYRAKDTRGNAKETADFIRGRNIKSILLITSFYHMPRSVFEVLKASPQIQIVPLPIFPKSFNNSVEWIRTRYAWLLFVEYHKFIVTRIQDLFERIYK